MADEGGMANFHASKDSEDSIINPKSILFKVGELVSKSSLFSFFFSRKRIDFNHERKNQIHLSNSIRWLGTSKTYTMDKLIMDISHSK